MNESANDSLSAGRYVHHKGGLYLLLFTAETHQHNGDIDVVYVSLTYGKTVTRPFRGDSRNQDAWLDMVEWPDGQFRDRFTPEEAFEPKELEALRRIWASASKG